MRCLPIRSGVGSSEPRPARGRSRIIRFSAPFREYWTLAGPWGPASNRLAGYRIPAPEHLGGEEG